MKPENGDGWCIKRQKLLLDSFHPYSESGAWERLLKATVTYAEGRRPSKKELENAGYELVAVKVMEVAPPEK